MSNIADFYMRYGHKIGVNGSKKFIPEPNKNMTNKENKKWICLLPYDTTCNKVWFTIKCEQCEYFKLIHKYYETRKERSD